MFKSLIVLITSSVTTKIIGVLRQAMYSVSIGVSSGYSGLLSLLSYVDALQIVSNTGNLNAYFFPKWDKLKLNKNSKIIITISLPTIGLIILLLLTIILYNYYVIKSGGIIEMLGASFIWIFILTSNVILSVFLYLELYEKFRVTAIINSLVAFLVGLTTFYYDFYGVLFSRYAALLFTIIYGYNQVKSHLEIRFSISSNRDEGLFAVLDNTLRLMIGSYAVLPLMICKILVSIQSPYQMSILFYAILVPSSVYLFTSKNLAPIWLKADFSGGRKTKEKLLFLAVLVILLQLLSAPFIPYFNDILFSFSSIDDCALMEINRISSWLMLVFSISSAVELFLLRVVRDQMTKIDKISVLFGLALACMLGLFLYIIIIKH